MFKSDTRSSGQSIWSWYPVTVLTAVFCCALWGSAAPAIKIAYRLFGIAADDTGSRIMLSGARFTLAGIMVILISSIMKKRLITPKRSSWHLIILLGLVQTVGQYYFYFMALAHASGVRVTLINAANNFFAILLAVYVFRLEKMTVRKLLGCAVGFLGLILILGGDGSVFSPEGLSFAGEGAVLLAGFFYAVSGCLITVIRIFAHMSEGSHSFA